jgi:hypothetical protein
MPAGELVSIGLPIRNGEHRVIRVVDSVLAQDHPNVEVVICDNASTDATEEVCRQLVRRDSRVVYHRHPENIGLMNNFVSAMRLAHGDYFRWIGDDDLLATNCLSRCLEVLTETERLLLVTSQIAYMIDDGPTSTARYDGKKLASDDPAERFVEMLRLQNESFLLIDPLYALLRRGRVASIPRRNSLREDQIFAAKMALAGPWGHIPDVLATRGWSHEDLTSTARKLDVATWQARFATVLQCRELLSVIRQSDLDEAQRQRARSAVFRLFITRHRNRLAKHLPARLQLKRAQAPSTS